jgi:hypothetical protein
MTSVSDYSTQRAPFEVPRHLKVTGPAPTFGFEPCEDVGCTVEMDGKATSCGRAACPACGCGGTNLSRIQLVDSASVRVRCTCGYAWVSADETVQSRPRSAAKS